MPHTQNTVNPEVAALEKAWWEDWWAQDFSWDGLASKTVNGHSLQSQWLAEKDSLILEPGTDRRWTRIHCPFVFKDGTPSPKATWTQAEWDAVVLLAGSASRWLSGAVLDRFEHEAKLTDFQADYAYIGKVIVLDFDKLNCSCRSAWLCGFYCDPAFLKSADFRNATFSGPAVFSGSTFRTGARFSGARFLSLAELLKPALKG